MNEAGMGRILVLDERESQLQETCKRITAEMPELSIVALTDAAECREQLTTDHFDIVVLDQDLPGGTSTLLLRELKLLDYEPLILGTTASTDSRVVAHAYNTGCQRCLVKDGDWLSELGPALRHLLRIRRLEEENARLIAKLTEANVLLHEKNKRLDEFSATVAHDIRGPLGGIAMRLEYLNDFYSQELDERFQHLLKTTLSATDRLIHIVQAMYEFAKLGSRAKQMTELSLEKIVREVVSDLCFDESREIHIGIDDLPIIWGNEGLLRKVFINLLSNAVKYNDKQTAIINVGISQTIRRSIGEFVEVFVSDNGQGIPSSECESIFTLFQRGRKSEQETEGIGLGLAVTKRIVEIHYGEIRVESREGEGTTFFFTLPVEEIDI